MGRILVVNADDFGQSGGVNRGIVEAHRRGIVTSASLMVRWPAAEEAAAMARECPRLAVGIHLDLGEWYLKDGGWLAHYEVAPLADAKSLGAEVERQLDAFSALMGRTPTHIDSHQHVHLREPLRGIVEAKARELSVPLRRCDTRIRYCGDFYGQDENGAASHDRITVDAMLALLEALPEGITELCCHPAAARDLDTMYSAERERELEALCEPRVRDAIDRLGIDLRSFAEVTS